MLIVDNFIVMTYDELIYKLSEKITCFMMLHLLGDVIIFDAFQKYHTPYILISIDYDILSYLTGKG